jgi:hypothetical protein
MPSSGRARQSIQNIWEIPIPKRRAE